MLFYLIRELSGDQTCSPTTPYQREMAAVASYLTHGVLSRRISATQSLESTCIQLCWAVRRPRLCTRIDVHVRSLSALCPQSSASVFEILQERKEAVHVLLLAFPCL